MSPLLRELLSLAIVVGLMGYSYWLGRERHAHRLRKAEAEVERLTAEGVAASERRDYFKARCEQQERDHAETVAEVEKLRDVVQRVRHLHRVHRCDGPAEDCLCADDRAEAGGDLCGHCTRPWPCPTAVYVRAQDGGAS